MITKQCVQCNSTFTTYNYLALKQKFCSAKCRQDNQKISFKGHNNPFYGKKHSDETKKKLSEYRTGKESPMKGVERLDIRGKKHPRNTDPEINKKIKKNWKISDEGRKIISDKMLKNNPVKRKEVREKISNTLRGRPQPWNKGEKCNFWRGGLSKENAIIKNSIEFKEFRRSVYERDNYTCVKCKLNKRILNVHHIKNFSNYKKLRTLTSNGVTLCLKCHRAFHRKNGIKNNTVKQLKEFLLNN